MRAILMKLADRTEIYMERINHWAGIAAILAIGATFMVILIPTIIRMIWR